MLTSETKCYLIIIHRYEMYNVSVAFCDGRVEQHFGVAHGTNSMKDNAGSFSFATEVSMGLV